MTIHCGDHGCVFGHPGGMGTNAGCRCIPPVGRKVGIEQHKRLHDQVRGLRTQCEEKQREIDRLGQSFDRVQAERKNLLALRATDCDLTISEWMMRAANAEAQRNEAVALLRLAANLPDTFKESVGNRVHTFLAKIDNANQEKP